MGIIIFCAFISLYKTITDLLIYLLIYLLTDLVIAVDSRFFAFTLFSRVKLAFQNSVKIIFPYTRFLQSFSLYSQN